MEASFKNQNLKGVFIMPVKNVIKKTKDMTGKIDPHYDMTNSNMTELYSAYSKYPYELMCYSFKFGYLQGMKAAKAEMKRREKANA